MGKLETRICNPTWQRLRPYKLHISFFHSIPCSSKKFDTTLKMSLVVVVFPKVYTTKPQFYIVIVNISNVNEKLS
jgi:hypothetical protein